MANENTKTEPKNIIIRNINPAMMKFNVEKNAYNKEGEKTGNQYKVTQVEFKNKEGVTYYFDVNPKDVRSNKKSPDAKASSYDVRLNPNSEHMVRRTMKENDTIKENEVLSKSGKVAYHKESALELQKNVQDASHALLNKFKALAMAKKEAPKQADDVELIKQNKCPIYKVSDMPSKEMGDAQMGE